MDHITRQGLPAQTAENNLIFIGFQDVTRRGFREGDIKHLCDLMLDVIKGKRKPTEVKEDVLALKKEFSQIKYGFQNVEEALSYIKKA